MKKMLAVMLMAAACGFGVSSLNAAGEKKAAAEKSAKPAVVKQVVVHGTVASIDDTQSTLVVKTKKGDESFKLDDATKVSVKKKAAAKTDIKAGQNVKVTAKEGVAVTVDIIK